MEEMAAPGRFWSWSLREYEEASLRAALLDLQDRFSFNVNVILFCCWCARDFEALPDGAIAEAMRRTEEWRASVTARLRAARRTVRLDTDDHEKIPALYDAIKSAELMAERVEQDRLEAFANLRLAAAAERSAQAVETRARRNLAGYAARLGAAAREGFSTALLHAVIDTIFNRAAPSGDPGDQDA